jgi:mannose-6-phosphate isomerase-like protein (cupin superfamily)
MQSSPFAINLRDAVSYVSVGELVTVLAAAEQTGGSFGLMEGVIARGAEPPPHVHHREDESFFVLEGEVAVRVGDHSFVATPGSFVFCPRGQAHVVTVRTEQVRSLTWVTPGGLESFFVELGEPTASRSLPAEQAPPDLERVATLAAHYGAEILTDWP